jgi:putative transcriptional regulator
MARTTAEGQTRRLHRSVPAIALSVMVLSVIVLSTAAVVPGASRGRGAPQSPAGFRPHVATGGQTGEFPQPVQSLEQPQAGAFLIAARGMLDPNFARSVVLLIDYDAQGAFGLIINRPTRHTLAELWPEITGLEVHPVYLGGPVFPNRLLFLLRSGDAPQEMRRVIPGIYLGSDELALKRIIAKAEEEFRTYAGYSGWAPGQLDNEIARGDWHIVHAERRFIFDPQPDGVWDELIQRVDSRVANLTQ